MTMPDLSADRPLPLPEKQFTEEDVQLVLGVLTDPSERGSARDEAVEILTLLAVAGRLPPSPTEHRERDLDVLAMVGRMYLKALDADPEHESLTLPEAMLVTEVRDAVERRERAWVEVDPDEH